MIIAHGGRNNNLSHPLYVTLARISKDSQTVIGGIGGQTSLELLGR